MPAISFISSATAILHQGCTPIFCDVDLENYCLCQKTSKKKFQKNESRHLFILLDHLVICKKLKIAKNKIKIIEDCSQAHGTYYNGKKLELWKYFMFSFYATKHMTTGEGGILCTNDKKIFNFCKSFETME